MHVLVLRNSSNPDSVDASLMLMAYLGSQDIPVTVKDALDIGDLDPADFSLVVSLGGDGTMLRAAHFVGVSELPILGLNFGHLGFLVNKTDDGVIAAVAAALCGDVVREERTNMKVEILCEGDDEDLFDSSSCDSSLLPKGRSFRCLNEAAITRGASGKIIDFRLNISGDRVADMRGDGLVVATATGSTAYALSAGGPLVAPGFGGLVVVPVAPHTLVARALVTDPHDIVEIELARNNATIDAELFVDGDLIKFDAPMRKIRIAKGEAPTVMLQYKKEGFYQHVSKVFFK